MKKLVSVRAIISALMTLFSICMMCVMSSEVKASEFELNVSGDGLYIADRVLTNEYRNDYDLGAFSFNVETVVRFTDYYALGIEIGMGGSSLGNSSSHWFISKEHEKLSDLGVMLQIFVTNKFIYSGDNFDFYGEIGVGGHILFADGYYNESGDLGGVNTWFGMRLRVGMTYYVTDSVGVGIHANGTYYLLNRYALGGGIHTTIKF